jgi:septal ring factor EnvC (AmiA/AmiB activator)
MTMDDYEKLKPKIKELEDMLWCAYPFMDLNSRFYQLNQDYMHDKEELDFYKNQVQRLTHQVENQRQEISYLKEKLSQFEAYIKSGQKIQELEKDFD